MPDDRPHVLVCDDEETLRLTVGEYLEKRGFRVTTVPDGAELDRALQMGNDAGVILLDIAMPGEDGLTVLRRLRAERSVAVIMLTAAGDVVDRIVGLELGADDYLAKPVDLRELEARIRTVLRRTGAAKVQRHEKQAIQVSFAGYVLDMEAAKLYDREKTEIPMTSMEFRLLKVLVENPGRVLNRDQLLELAHDRGWDPLDRSIDIRISRLRRKIERNPSKPEIIRTVRGLGYLFDPDGD